MYEFAKRQFNFLKQLMIYIKVRRLLFLKENDIDLSQIRPNVLPRKDPKDIRIAFLIPGLPAFSGGHTSILRLGTYLHDFGYNISYISYKYGTRKTMERNARINLPYYHGMILDKKHMNDFFDISISTAWDSAYLLYERPNLGYRVYFVQNYDPTFYPFGDEYFISKNSYYLGNKIVSLGQWNKYMIEKNCPGVEVSMVDYPYEPRQYRINRREISISSPLRLAVFIKENPQRAPLTLLLGLAKLKEKMKDDVEINIFGLHKRLCIPFANNLGMLSHEELKALYIRCHIGISASMTNVSLVPFEMIASGLPVIEFADGSFSFFFKKESSILVDTLPSDLYRKVMYCKEHPEMLNRMLVNAQDELRGNTWERTARQFEKIIFS